MRMFRFFNGARLSDSARPPLRSERPGGTRPRSDGVVAGILTPASGRQLIGKMSEVAWDRSQTRPRPHGFRLRVRSRKSRQGDRLRFLVFQVRKPAPEQADLPTVF